ncbi:MAG: cytochrome c-type biogenesis protein [Burkholderiaceae bacterium]
MAGPVKTEVTLPPLTAAQQARMKTLSEELRCLVCQNQTLADSNADLAGDLRNQVHELVASGRDNDQIKTYLVSRYGDYVLYRPPVQRNTALLWGGPFALLAIGAASWFVIQRRQKRAGATAGLDATNKPSDAARQRARDLLNDKRS